MNAVLMDKAVVGADSIVGALAFVPQGMNIPPRSVVVGNPARIVKEVSDEQLSWKTEGTAWYQALPKDCEQSLEECQPLKTDDPGRPRASEGYGPRGK
jgi:carbonic anhydrase/acetyltransferase-like protein (isoleucine patch superfamily)